MHKRGAFSRQPSYEASKIEKPSDKRTTRNWAQRAAAVLELATGALWSTRAWMAAARAHVLKAAAESVWHETFVQVLMLLHTVAEVESFCGSTVSGRDSTARGS